MIVYDTILLYMIYIETEEEKFKFDNAYFKDLLSKDCFTASLEIILKKDVEAC